MSIPCDKNFPLVPLLFTLWHWSLTHLKKNFNFWTRNARALIFHMSIPCDKTCPWVPLFFTLWPWPWSLTHCLKTLTLLTSLTQWVPEFWYFTWVFRVIWPFRGNNKVFACDLDLGVDFRFENLLITFEQGELDLWFFT